MAAQDLLGKIIEDVEPAGETRGPRAFAFPALRPYLPDRRFLRRVGTGLVILATATRRRARQALHHVLGTPAAKPTTKDEFLDAAELVGAAVLVAVVVYAALAGVLAVVGPRLLPYLPLATGVGVLGLLAAYALGPDTTPGVATAEEAAEPDAESPALAPLSPDALAQAVRQIAVPRGWAGAHIATLADHLGVDRASVLDTLAEAGIAVTDQLKLRLPDGRQSNRQGVRLEHLPPGLGEDPSGPLENSAAGASEVVDRTLPEGTITHPHGP